jgi:hypothetical protein
MNTSLATFMKTALTVIVIVALLFAVGYQMVENEITNGTTGYKTSIESKNPPTTTAPSSR